MKFDELLTSHIGELGKYQIIILFCLGLEEIFMAFQVMNPVFTAGKPDNYWCKHPQINNNTIFGNMSLDDRLRMTIPSGSGNDVNDDGLSKCSIYDINFETDAFSNITQHSIKTCEGEWMFDSSMFSSTMVTEWSLVCTGTKTAMAKSLSAVFLAGRSVGSVIFGWVTDRYGRRPVFLFAGVASVCVAVSTALVPNYISFVILRFFQAVLATGKTSAGFVMAMEYSGPSRRAAVGSLYFTFWAVGMCILTGIAYFIRDWRTLLLAISVPELVAYVIAYFRVPESPRWLYSMNRRTEADKIVQDMAKTNGVKLPQDFNITEEATKSTVTPLALVRTPNLRATSLILAVVWFSGGLSYYGLNFGTGDLGGNVYINTVISGATEIPAQVLIIVLFAYVGRIVPFSGSFLLGGVSLLLAMLLIDSVSYYWAFITLTMVGKFSISVATTMVWLYCGECYPTVMRTIGLSITNVAARVSSPMAPFVILLAVVHIFLPSIIYATFAIISGILILYLPETRGKILVQTVDEGENFIKENRLKIWRCSSGNSRSDQYEINTISTNKMLNTITK